MEVVTPVNVADRNVYLDRHVACHFMNAPNIAGKATLTSIGLTGTSYLIVPAAYPKRSLLRCGLDVCSISQIIHTKAVPKPTTTPKNSNVRPGAVSMVSIHEPNIHEPISMNQCKRRTSRWPQENGLGAEYTGAAKIFAGPDPQL
jgi:hypothetical protein